MLKYLALLPLLLLPAFYPIGFFTNEKYEFDPVEGPYATNMDLNGAEIRLPGHMPSPESFDVRKDDPWIYTGLGGGSIVKFHPDTFAVQLIAKSEDPGCAGPWDKRCGRPLGIRFRTHSELIVADANRGILSVNVDTGTVKTLLSSSTLVDGEPLTLVNDVDVDNEGNIYFSQSTSDVGLDFGMFTSLASGSGRLMKLDAKTGEISVLLTRLQFANGVQMSQDKSFVLVADGFKGRIMRYYLTGPKKDTADAFITKVPGGLDNIRSNGKGGFLVAVPFVHDPANINPLMLLEDYPLIRAGIARFWWTFRYPFAWITENFPNAFTGMIKDTMGGFGLMDLVTKVHHSMILELDGNGKVLRSMHAVNSDFVRISCAFRVGNRMYLGSYIHNAVAFVPYKG